MSVAFIYSQWRPALNPPHTSGSFGEEREAVLGHPSSLNSPLWHSPEPLELLTVPPLLIHSFFWPQSPPSCCVAPSFSLVAGHPCASALGPAADGEDDEHDEPFVQ